MALNAQKSHIQVVQESYEGGVATIRMGMNLCIDAQVLSYNDLPALNTYSI